MERDGTINLDDLTATSPINTLSGDTVQVPKRLIQMLGVALLNFKKYFPEDMELPSVGVSIRKNTTTEEE
jgi:hypothetical protein